MTSRTFTPEQKAAIVAEICALIADGGKVAESCETAGITWRDLWNWKAADAEFAAQYARARSVSGVSWADRASRAVEDMKVPEGQEVQAARVKAAHYEWRAKVASPREFGEKVDVTTDGAALTSAVVILPALDAIPVPPDGAVILESLTRAVVAGPGALAAALAAQLKALKGGEPIPSIDQEPEE